MLALAALAIDVGHHLVAVTLEGAIAVVIVLVTSCAIAARLMHALLLPLRTSLILRPAGNGG
jgi:hypothetical protein